MKIVTKHNMSVTSVRFKDAKGHICIMHSPLHYCHDTRAYYLGNSKIAREDILELFTDKEPDNYGIN